MTRPSLVIGASGQVGEHCLALLQSRNNRAIGTYKTHERPNLLRLNVNDSAALHSLIEEYQPSAIYWMACVANVDYCETNPDKAYGTNVAALCNAVKVANTVGAKFVFMSSEYLFDGKGGPYDESAPADPLSKYGCQKLAAEHYIAAFCKDWLIIRTSGVFSWESQGKNFVYRLRNSLLAKEQIKVPVDQISTPTYAPDLVAAIVDLVDRKQCGIFNVAGSRVANRYEFALAAALTFDLDSTLVVPVKTSEFGQAAARPLQAGLRTAKVEAALGRSMLSYEAGLRLMAANTPAEMTKSHAI